MNNECLVCKKHFTQSGTCTCKKNKCLLFEEEPRGRKLRGTFRFRIDTHAETKIIKSHTWMGFVDNGKDFDAEIIRINYIDMASGIISVEADYYESEMPRSEKRKRFKVKLTGLESFTDTARSSSVPMSGCSDFARATMLSCRC